MRLGRPVVVTGLGSLDATGVGPKSLAAALASGRAPRSEIARPYRHGDGGSRLAALVGEADLTAWVPATAARRMSAPSRFAVAAARMALADAGLPSTKGELDPSTAVYLATTWGPISFTEKLLEQVFLEGPEAASPYYFTESVANAPAAQIALFLGATGPNVTVTRREAGALVAVAKGAADVAAGRTAVALAGAVDEMPPLLHAVLDRFGALSRPRPGHDEAARPFDRDRDGAVAGEGAAVAVLELEETARRRGAPILARVEAAGAAFDPAAPPTGWSRDPAPLAAALRQGLADAFLSPADLDRVVAGAAGSRAGDRLEAGVLATLLGPASSLSPAPVLAPKAIVGELSAGQLAAAVLAATGAPFGPTAGFATPDPELAVVPHDGRQLPPARRILVTSLATGGALAWLVLAAGDPR